MISRRALTHGYSLEVSTKAIPALIDVAPRIPAGKSIFIPYLPGEDDYARLNAATRIRELGFLPTPHIPARRMRSLAELQSFVARAVSEADAQQCFVIGGDLSMPLGPFVDSATLIETGVLERAGITSVGVAGHPEGHAVMGETQRWDVLVRKCNSIRRRGMEPFIVTQFGFDADIVLTWLQALRQHDIQALVRVGVPGPAGAVALARYAALCGVGASASILSRYGVSIGKLLGTTGPDRFVDRLLEGLNEAHGRVELHFFPFGGVAQSLAWIAQYRDKN